MEVSSCLRFHRMHVNLRECECVQFKFTSVRPLCQHAANQLFDVSWAAKGAYDGCGFAMGQVATALAELPLAPALQRLERVFAALNTVCAFLLTQHIQACPLIASAGC